MPIVFVSEIVFSYLLSMMKSSSSSLLLMHGQIMSRENSIGLGHINILLDLSSTRDYRILLYKIDIIEKMLGCKLIFLSSEKSQVYDLLVPGYYSYLQTLLQTRFFFTMTVNPKWLEILHSLFSGQIATDHPDIVSWIFEQKKKVLLKLIDNGFFGTIVAYIHTIEFQKRGLFHIYLLIFLYPQHCI